MGEQADDAVERALNDYEPLLEYLSGNMPEDEAVEQNVLDETGSLPNDTPDIWGVHDFNSLTNLLNHDTLILENLELKRKQKEVPLKWWSGRKSYYPYEMTTDHLANAIKYAERNKIQHPVVEALKEELKKRLSE